MATLQQLIDAFNGKLKIEVQIYFDHILTSQTKQDWFKAGF